MTELEGIIELHWVRGGCRAYLASKEERQGEKSSGKNSLRVMMTNRQNGGTGDVVGTGG